MNITIGLSLDGFEPQVPLEGIDQLTCGPSGLLTLLETRLGLKFKTASRPQRIAQYRQILKSVAVIRRSAFFAASLQKDAYAVAETLLDWRDQLIEAGWNGEVASTDSSRLQDLAAVEMQARDQLALGAADRLARILKELHGRSPQINSIVVVDDPVFWPNLWRKIFARLGARFEATVDTLRTEQPVQDSDLANVRAALTSSNDSQPAKIHLKADGSIQVLTAFSETTLASAVAQIIAKSRQAGLTQTLLASDSAVPLEQALIALNEPALGLEPRSRARPIPQVLALALQLYWEPVDPRFILEFLTHPVCPVPKFLRRALAKAVSQSPGIGSREWVNAIKEAKARAEQDSADNPEGQVKALKKIQQALDEWLLVPRSDAAKGAKGPVLAACCARVAAWAAAYSSVDNLKAGESEQFKMLSTLSSEMSQLLKPLDCITRSQLDRMLQVSSTGWSGGSSLAQLGHLHRVMHPGAIMETADVVIWWDFVERAFLARLPWTESELKQWKNNGAEFVSPETLAIRERADWLRPILAARKQVLLVSPRFRGGEPLSPHSLQARILSLLGKNILLPTTDLDSVVAAGQPLGLFNFRTLQHRPLPGLRRWWKMDSGTNLVPREQESYSSAEKFIYSPYHWVLRYSAQLKAGPLSDCRFHVGNTQCGNLLHRLLDLLLMAPAEKIYWKTASKSQLEQWIEDEWNDLLHQEGANLLLPGQRAKAAALLETGKTSLWELLKQLRDAGVIEACSNHTLPPAAFEGGKIGGTLDLVVKNKQGGVAVVDLKYGGTTVREKELKENRALQLVIYGYLWHAAHAGEWPETAFFILNKQSLIAQKNDFFPAATLLMPKGESFGIQQSWIDFLEVWNWRRQQLNDGWIEVTLEDANGQPLPEGAPASTSPHATWVPAKDQDKFNDYDALTGWRIDA